MAHLDRLAPAAIPAAHEAPRPEAGYELVDSLEDARGVAREGELHGATAHADDLDEATRRGLEHREPLGDHVVERHGAEGRGRICARPFALASRDEGAHELLDKEGAPAGLAGDRLRDLEGRRALRVEQRARERPRVVHRERPDREIAHLGRNRPAGAHLEHEGARGRLLVAVGHHDEQRRRERGAHGLEQQVDAVGVAPLHVVDPEDQRPAARQLGEHPPQRGERVAPHVLRVGGRGLHGGGDGRHAPQHREQTREGPDVGRHRDGAVVVGEPHQVPAQRVDDAVEGLVGHRLALVGAAAQGDGLAAPDQAVEELLDERRLAHAGGAVDQHGDGAPGLRVLERRPGRSRKWLSRPTSGTGARSASEGIDARARSARPPRRRST